MQDQEQIISRLKGIIHEVQMSKFDQFTELIQTANTIIADIFGPQYKSFSISHKQKFKNEDSPSAKYMKEMYWLQTNRPGLISFLRKFIEELESTRRVYILLEEPNEMSENIVKTVKQLGFIPKYFYDTQIPRKSVIEILKAKNDVGFIIVIIPPNPFDGNKDESNDKGALGANLFFDLGYLAGKLTLEKVVALYQETEGFEVPSDLQDVLYFPFKEGWQEKLCDDLKQCGYQIDD